MHLTFSRRWPAGSLLLHPPAVLVRYRGLHLGADTGRRAEAQLRLDDTGHSAQRGTGRPVKVDLGGERHRRTAAVVVTAAAE